MEITLNNFNDKYDELLEIVKKSDYISLDLELTGISTEYVFNEDSVQSRYEFFLEKAMPISITELGITCVQYDKSSSEWKYNSFNLLVRKRHHNVVIAGDTIDFLLENNFNFDKNFMNGINFLSLKEYETKLENMEINFKEQNMLRKLISQEPIKKDKYKDIIKEIEDVKKDSFPIKINIKSMVGKNRIVMESVINKLLLKQNLYIYKDERTWILESDDNPETAFKKKINDLHQLRLNKHKELIKISLLVEQIFAKNRVLVAHNCLLDLMHIYHKFVGPLPQKVEEFRELFKDIKIFDTKYLAKNMDLGKHPLEGLYKYFVELNKDESVNKNQFKLVDDMMGYKLDLTNNNYHSADYDSFVTMLVFLYILQHKNNNNPIDSSSHSLVNIFDKCINIVNCKYLLDNETDFNEMSDKVYRVELADETLSQTQIIIKLSQIFKCDLISLVNEVRFHWCKSTNPQSVYITTKLQLAGSLMSETGDYKLFSSIKRMRTKNNSNNQNTMVTTTHNNDSSSNNKTHKRSNQNQIDSDNCTVSKLRITDQQN